MKEKLGEGAIKMKEVHDASLRNAEAFDDKLVHFNQEMFKKVSGYVTNSDYTAGNMKHERATSHMHQLEEKVKELENLLSSVSTKVGLNADTLSVVEENVKTVESKQQNDLGSLMLKVEDGLEVINKKVVQLNRVEENFKDQLR